MIVAFATLLALGSASGNVAAQDESDTRINQIQILGSHNSYRPVPGKAAQAQLRAALGERASGLEYGHPSIARQLDMGVRQLELDPYSDPAGGRFAAPYRNGPAAAFRTMERPGLKVLHMPVVDRESHCLTLVECFRQIAAWSRAHPGHELIVITVDTKEAPVDAPGAPAPLLYDAARLDEIDATAWAEFGRGALITPDDVRGRHPTLRSAVMAGNWPSARSARGKVMLILDSNPRIAALYKARHPNLAGRAMFGVYGAADPEAAVFNIQDPVTEEARITGLVRQGFFVRTRSDANTLEARSRNLARLRAAVRSGAQVISTDYYSGAPDPFGLKFEVRLANGFHQPNQVMTGWLPGAGTR